MFKDGRSRDSSMCWNSSDVHGVSSSDVHPIAKMKNESQQQQMQCACLAMLLQKCMVASRVMCFALWHFAFVAADTQQTLCNIVANAFNLGNFDLLQRCQ